VFSFRNPVPIGSILLFTSSVVFSRAPISSSFQIMVTAEVIDPSSGARVITNIFNFTFSSSLMDTKHLSQVLPRTYEESMKYLEGKRKWEMGFEIAKENDSTLLAEW
jgi:acyl-coenzyme A thioesterase 9